MSERRLGHCPAAVCPNLGLAPIAPLTLLHPDGGDSPRPGQRALGQRPNLELVLQ